MVQQSPWPTVQPNDKIVGNQRKSRSAEGTELDCRALNPIVFVHDKPDSLD
jgi:hypothetical protein